MDEDGERKHNREEEGDDDGGRKAPSRLGFVHRIDTTTQPAIEVGEQLGHRLLYPAMID